MQETLKALPAVSAELALMFAMTRALAAQLGRKDRTSFLDDVERSLEIQAATYNVVRVRSPAQDRAVSIAVQEALAWWRAARPAMEKMPPV